MDKEVKTEVRLRTVKLHAQTEAKSRLDRIELKLIHLYGKRLPKLVKIALAKREINKIFAEPINIEQDAINQLKYIDRA